MRNMKRSKKFEPKLSEVSKTRGPLASIKVPKLMQNSFDFA